MAAKRILDCGFACSVTSGAAGFVYGGVTGAFRGFNRQDDFNDKMGAAFFDAAVTAGIMGAFGLAAPVLAIPVLIGVASTYVGSDTDDKKP